MQIQKLKALRLIELHIISFKLKICIVKTKRFKTFTEKLSL